MLMTPCLKMARAGHCEAMLCFQPLLGLSSLHIAASPASLQMACAALQGLQLKKHIPPHLSPAMHSGHVTHSMLNLAMPRLHSRMALGKTPHRRALAAQHPRQACL